MKTTDDRRPTTVIAQPPAVFRHPSSVPELRSPVSGLRFFILAAASIILGVFLFSVAFAVDGDIVFKREGGAGGVAVAVFPHWSHRIRYKCYACHPALFEMKAGARKISMEAIQEGKFCGACHNGKIAWGATFETCNRCHIAR